MSNEIYLIRHAQSEANVENVFGADMPLSFIGRAQAIRARKVYHPIMFDKVYSSTLQRTKDTAKLLFGKPLPESNKLEEFNEIWFGKAEGLKNTITGIAGYKYQYKDNFIEFMKECEGDDPFERVKIALDKMQELSNEIKTHPQQYPNKRIGIVTSDTLMRCIILTLNYQKNWDNINNAKSINNLDALKFTYDEELARVEHFHEGDIMECLYER